MFSSGDRVSQAFGYFAREVLSPRKSQKNLCVIGYKGEASSLCSSCEHKVMRGEVRQDCY